jgi:zinc D-Ala-D-Ala carboxypeptidase
VGDLSPHFDRSEFRCRHCGHLEGPSPALVVVLEHIRGLVGRPLVVVSGTRCQAHNKAVGGAARSRHLAGDAADLRFGVVPVATAEAAGATGIGIAGRFAVHVDTRPGRRARWRY